jgi:hypothetical protein
MQLRGKINRMMSNKFIKTAIIFGVGLTLRYLINNWFDVNVFTDYLHPISFLYYGFIASFSVLLDDLSFDKLSYLKPRNLCDLFHSLRESNKANMVSGGNHLTSVSINKNSNRGVSFMNNNSNVGGSSNNSNVGGSNNSNVGGSSNTGTVNTPSVMSITDIVWSEQETRAWLLSRPKPRIHTTSFQAFGESIERAALHAADCKDRSFSGAKIVKVGDLGFSKNSPQYHMLLRATRNFAYVNGQDVNFYTQITSPNWKKATIYTDSNISSANSSFGGGNRLIDHIKRYRG